MRLAVRLADGAHPENFSLPPPPPVFRHPTEASVPACGRPPLMVGSVAPALPHPYLHPPTTHPYIPHVHVLSGVSRACVRACVRVDLEVIVWCSVG